MKKLFYPIIALLAIFAVACGDDGPKIDRTRDVEFSVSLLSHVTGGEKPIAYISPSSFTLSQKRLTLDGLVTVNTDDHTFAQFVLEDFPLTKDENGNIYRGKAATTSNTRLTDFSVVVNFDDQVVDLFYVVDGKLHVTATDPNLFFGGAKTVLNFDDGTSYNDDNVSYTLKLAPRDGTATLNVADLLYRQDYRYFDHIIAEELQAQVTNTGFTVAGQQILPRGDYRRAGSNSEITVFVPSDSLFFRIDDMALDIDVAKNTINGSYTLVKLTREKDGKIVERSRANITCNQ